MVKIFRTLDVVEMFRTETCDAEETIGLSLVATFVINILCARIKSLGVWLCNAEIRTGL